MNYLGIFCLVTTLVIPHVEACGNGYFGWHMAGSCTNNTCDGYCEDTNTCCHDNCIDDHGRINDLSAVCAEQLGFNNTGQSLSCQNFISYIICIAAMMNKTYDVIICYRDVITYFRSYTNALTGSDLDLLRCPCGEVYRRLVGTCDTSTPLCTNNSCINMEDTYLGEHVCCVESSRLPSDRCRKHEERHVSLNTSTVAACSETCDGTCLQSNPDKLPVCCTSQHHTGREGPRSDVDTGAGLHGGVVALIVVFIAMLLALGAFAAVYLYRRKYDKGNNQKGEHSEEHQQSIDNFDAISSHANSGNSGGYDNGAYENVDTGEYRAKSGNRSRLSRHGDLDELDIDWSVDSNRDVRDVSELRHASRTPDITLAGSLSVNIEEDFGNEGAEFVFDDGQRQTDTVSFEDNDGDCV